MVRQKIKNPSIQEAIVIDEWQLMTIFIEIDNKKVVLLLKIRNSKENKKLYIDKLKSLDLAIIEEIYESHYAGKFNAKDANFCISEIEYNQMKK